MTATGKDDHVRLAVAQHTGQASPPPLPALRTGAPTLSITSGSSTTPWQEPTLTWSL